MTQLDLFPRRPPARLKDSPPSPFAARDGRVMHRNSVLAYDAERQRLSKRAQMVLDYFGKNGPGTDRECMAGLGFADMNAVRPRITELIADGFLAEIGTAKCPETGMPNRVLRAVSRIA